jgi:anti-anti-sigma factor
MRTKNQKGVFKITPGMELNASTAAKAGPQLQKALDKTEDARAVALDFTETSTFDSGTLKLLLAIHRECLKRGVELQIQASEAAKEFLGSLNLQRRMSITAQEAAE